MYSYPYDITVYVRSLHYYIEQQNTRISHLEKILENIEKELKEIKNKPTTHIDKIEYKFDQLKVETLEGTLNIGLNPTNGEQIEDFAVSQSKMNIPEVRHSHKDLVHRIQNEIDAYLNNECSVYIQNMLTNERSSLPVEHVQFIVEDIQKQINERIIFYLEQKQAELQDPARLHDIFEATVDRLKLDIQNSITAYLNNLPENMKEGKDT
ncbi:spore germination protein GerPC [Bacillus sp. REN16]|uniref:spore germination protein GerPC n=1 Tax=Bacillus sp. REN16 TaxID=2887296 RepID=UPI001E515A1D|nr:spore germination protein GerPC [Bacillus sp. REN16]MCC3355536.1 spore germination protein GerPC [Bacillus sp. REN16]